MIALQQCAENVRSKLKHETNIRSGIIAFFQILNLFDLLAAAKKSEYKLRLTLLNQRVFHQFKKQEN